MKTAGCGRYQKAFTRYVSECEEGAHDEICPYYFAGKYSCSVRRAQQLIKKYLIKSGKFINFAEK